MKRRRKNKALKKAIQVLAEVLAIIATGIILTCILNAILLYGNDSNCTYVPCSCSGYEQHYRCIEHGHNCLEQD